MIQIVHLISEIQIYTPGTLGSPIRLNSGGANSDGGQPIRILFDENRFWAMVTRPPEVLGEETGMGVPSQTSEGKYKLHQKKKGPTRPMKPKGPSTRATRDELRRREEKAKSEYETRIEAMEVTMDSIKADAGEKRDKIRNMEAYGKCQNQYIAALEKRFVNLCDSCKKRDCGDTAFTPQEKFTLQRILELLEKQEMRHSGAAGEEAKAPAVMDSEKEKVKDADNL